MGPLRMKRFLVALAPLALLLLSSCVYGYGEVSPPGYYGPYGYYYAPYTNSSGDYESSHSPAVPG